MNKGEFISILKNPQEIDKGFIPELQNVVNDYPYFQSAQLLLTKAFHSSENLNFESSLKKTAAYAANRKQLHTLLFSNVITEPTTHLKSEETPEKDLQKEKLLIASTTEANAPETIEVREPQIEVSTVKEETTSTAIDSINQVQITPEESIITPKVEISEAEQDKILADKLEQQIVSSAINSSILLEVSDEIPEIDSLSPTVEVEKNEPVIVQATTAETSESDRSFSDWIRHFGDDLVNENEPEEEVENTIYIKDSQEKTEFYSATKMAKLSVQEDDDLVTETLASIYADQGSFEKAIKAFKKLQLKYPEKRVYFAGRIKEIQNQIN